MPKLSIITVVLNSIQFIEESINSVVSQTYNDIEYIIIDGGSTDGTLDIIDKYCEDIDILVSEPDNGIYDAMNKGISLATGEWVLMLNADDYLIDDQVIEKVIPSLTDSSDLIYGTALMKFEDNGFFENYSTVLSLKNLSRGKVPPHMAVFAKRSIVKELGGYDTSYRLVADFDFYVRFLLGGYKPKRIDLCCSVFRIHDEARSPYRLHKFWAEAYVVINRHFGISAAIRYKLKTFVGSILRRGLLFSGLFSFYRKLRGVYSSRIISF